MPKRPVTQRQREDRHADDRQQAEDVVLAMREHGLVRRLEPVDDLLVVVEEVPDPLGRVDDVVEVVLEVLRKEGLDAALEDAERRALGLDDLAVRDDLLLHVGDVAHDLLRTPFEHLVLDPVELVGDLVEDREAVVEEVVEDLVQQATRAAGEELLAVAARPPRSARRGG